MVGDKPKTYNSSRENRIQHTARVDIMFSSVFVGQLDDGFKINALKTWSDAWQTLTSRQLFQSLNSFSFKLFHHFSTDREKIDCPCQSLTLPPAHIIFNPR
jgi:hypothetical protein